MIALETIASSTAPCPTCERSSQTHRELACFVLRLFCGVFGGALLIAGGLLLIFGAGTTLISLLLAFAAGPVALLGALGGAVSTLGGLALITAFDFLERRIDVRHPRFG